MKIILAALTIALSSVASAQAQPAPAPKTDAQGVPVVSAPSTAPAGANSTVTIPPGGAVHVSPNQAAVFKPTEVHTSPPPCSRSVTDRCVQNYEGRTTGTATHRSRRHRRR